MTCYEHLPLQGGDSINGKIMNKPHMEQYFHAQIGLDDHGSSYNDNYASS